MELVAAANRLPIQESVYSHTCECLARYDRPRKTMVCPTFSIEMYKLKRRINNPP
jgi:hypothetical protein